MRLASAGTGTGARPQSPARPWRRFSAKQPGGGGLLTGSASHGRLATTNSWAAEAARGAQQQPHVQQPLQQPHQSRAALFELRRDRAALLGQAASPADLLVSTDECVPPSRIPEAYHIKLALPERPAQLDEYGARRFAWTSDAAAEEARRLAGMAGAAKGGARGDSACSGALTVFPMQEPHGSLDVPLLEQVWLASDCL